MVNDGPGRPPEDYDALVLDLELHREELRFQTQQLLEAQSQLESSRDVYLDLYEFAPVPYVTFDWAGNVRAINLTGCALLGRDRHAIVGYPFQAHLVEGARWAFLQHMWRCRRAEGRQVTPLTMVRGDGGEVPVELVTQPFRRFGEDTYRSAIIDVTDRRSIEEKNRELQSELLERTLEAEGRAQRLRDLSSALFDVEERERRRLAKDLHDDLGQDLAACLLLIHRFRSRVGFVADEDLGRVESLVDRANRTIRALTSQLWPPVLQDVGLVAALEWLARDLGETHGLRVLVAASGDAETAVPLSMKTILYRTARELLLNVAQHAGIDRAGVRLRGEADEIELLVEDEGRGFEPSLLDRPGPANGLGLLSIRERIDALGGAVSIQSTPGGGTRVEIRLPRSVEARAALPVPPPEPATGPCPTGGKIRVLLADDHAVFRQGMAALLRDTQDIEIVGEAADGLEAVDRATELRPDVILMDVTMPELSGIEATRILAGSRPNVRIVGLSMHVDQSVADAMRSAGAAEYLSKGGSLDELLAAIRGHPVSGRS